MRCARCAAEWIPAASILTPPPLADLPAAPPRIASPAHRAEDAKPQPIVASEPLGDIRPGRRGRPASRGAVAAAWVATALLLGGLGAAAYLFRDTVQAVWPPSQRVYAALGIGG